MPQSRPPWILAALLGLPMIAGGCEDSTPRGAREVPVDSASETGRDSQNQVGGQPTRIPMH